MRTSNEIIYIGLVQGDGGDAFQMLELAAGIQERGYKPKIIVQDLEYSEDFAARCRERGVEVERTPLLRLHERNFSRKTLDYLALFRQYRKKFIHIHTAGIWLPRSMMVAIDLLMLSPIFVTVQCPFRRLEPGTLLTRYWASFTSRHIYKIVCPSNHARLRHLQCDVPDNRLQVINNSVNLDLFNGGDASVARKYLGLPAQQPLVVFTSRLAPQKRPMDALNAFIQITERHSDAHMVFVGEGENRHELEQRVSELKLTGCIHFVGHQENVADWLAASDVWILPTETENFSLALLEALGAGCAIVSTMCQGNDEVLEPGVNALTTDVGDVVAQAAALDQILSDKDLAGRLRQNARSTGLRYSSDHMVDEYLNAYHAAVPTLVP